MATLRPEEKIDVLGPLGNGFKVNHRARISVLVAGGMGVAGLHLLLKQLVDKSTAQHKIYTLIGARSREGLYILDTYRQLPSSARLIATEDGSKGVKGLVTMLLEKLLSTQLPSDTEDILRTKCITRVPRPAARKGAAHTGEPRQGRVIQVYACGPEGMLKEVCRIAQTRAIPCQVSLERQMGCGLGICRACVCKVKDGETVRYATVCSDGPVFEAGQIVY